MDMEVGLKITRDAGDITFASSDTEATLITAAHLPGFARDQIEVAMNEGERKFSIRGHLANQEAVITTSRVAITQELSVHCFEETFSVSDNVDWDGIDAWFDEENEILIISIPKSTTNECLLIGTEETSEVAMKEEGQISKKLVLREPREQKEEKNRQPELPHKVKKKVGEQQTNTRLPQWPSVPEEQLQPGERDAENKAADHPQYPECKEGLQKNGATIEQLDQVDEETQEYVSLRVKRHMQPEAELHISYKEKWENDLDSKGALPDGRPREGYGKPSGGIEEERNMILEWMGSEAREGELHPSKKEQPSQREEHKEHKTPTIRPNDQEQEAKLFPEIKKPRDPSQARRYKILGVTEEPDTRKPSKQNETLQQLQTIGYEQKHEKPQAMGTDQAFEADQLIKSKEGEELGKKEQEKDEKFRTKKFKETEEQILEAAHQCFHSELKEESKQNEKGVQKHEKSIAMPVYEKPKDATLPQMEEPKPKVYELHNDEENRWMGLDKEVSKTKKLLSSKEVSQAFLSDKKQSAPDQVLDAAKQIQSEDTKEKLKHDKEVEHEKEVKEHEEFIVTTTYKNPEVIGIIENEEKKLELYVVAVENEDKQRKKTLFEPPRNMPDIEERTKSAEKEKQVNEQQEQPKGKYLLEHWNQTIQLQQEKSNDTMQSTEQKKLDRTIEMPRVRAPKKVPETAVHIQSEEFSSKMQRQEQEMLEFDKSTVKEPSKMLESAELAKSEKEELEKTENKEKLTEHELLKSRVRTPVKVPEAAPQINSEIQKEVLRLINPDSQLLKSVTEVSKTENSQKTQEEPQGFQQEEEKMTRKIEKPTVKARKKLFEGVEPTKSEDKEAKKEVEQSEEQQAHECKKTIIEEPYQTPVMIDFTALEKEVIKALVELDSKGISKPQEQYQNKGSKEFEKHDEGSLTNAPNIEELRSSGEQEDELQEQKGQEDGNKSFEPQQSKENKEQKREKTNAMTTYKKEMHNKIKLSSDGCFKHESIIKSPEKFPKLIHFEREFQKSPLYKEIRESVETNQEIFQEGEEGAPIPQSRCFLKELETDEVLERQEAYPDQESKYFKAQGISKHTTAEENESQLQKKEKVALQYKRFEPHKTDETDKQESKQKSRMPNNQEKDSLLEFRAEKNKTLIEGENEINGLPESQKPFKKTEEDLQIEWPKEENAEDRRCPAVESETSNKSAVTNEREKSVRGEDFYQQEEDVEQSAKSSKSWKQPTKTKQTMDLEGLQISMEQVAQKQPKVEQEERQPRRPQEEEATEGEPTNRETARNSAMNEAATKQELYQPEKQEESLGILSKKEEKNPALIQTELPIQLNGIKGVMASKGSPLQFHAEKEAVESPSPALFQTELQQSLADLQNLEENKGAQRQIPVLEGSTENKVEKTKEEIQEQSSSPLFVHGIKALEEIQRREEASSREEEETSRAGSIKCAKASRQKRRRRFHSQRSGRNPAFPLPPSTLFAGSAFVFSAMVLVFHFINPKKYN